MNAAAAPALAPVPFARLVRVETAKSVDTRSARWLLGLSLLALAGTLVIGMLASVDHTPRELVRLAATAGATLLPVVAILLITTEWTQRTLLVTFVQEPRRLRVLAAKIVAALGLALAVTLLCVVLAYAALALGALTGTDVRWTSPGPVPGVVGYVLLEVLMGLAFGALLQHSGAAITLFFVLPVVVAAVLSIPGLEGARPWVNADPEFMRLVDGHPHAGRVLAGVALWIALPLALGAVRTLRREVA